MPSIARFLDQYGPWALVAGASEGLGAAFAEELAQRGFHLVLVARREHVLRSLARRLEDRHGIEVRCVIADLSHEHTVDTIVDQCSDLDLGLLVYNAAYAPIGEFATIGLDEIRLAAAVNVQTPTTLIHRLLPQFSARRRAGIVLMSSLAGGQGAPRIAMYGATKAYTTVLAEGLWSELEGVGIDVTGCISGAVRTPGLTQAVDAGAGKSAPGTLDAMRIARAALGGLGRRPVVVPGLINKTARFFLSRMLPSRTAIRIMASSTGTLGGSNDAHD